MASEDAVNCPWCEQPALKDSGCNHVVCGVDGKGFNIGSGCGMQFCFECGKKLCRKVYCEITGVNLKSSTNHNKMCCTKTPGFDKDYFCSGGHNSHCSKRW